MSTILIIDDDPANADLMKRVLEKAGHTILIEHQGISGVKSMVKKQVDLVILDMNLPDMTGDYVIKLIRRLPGSIPVVVVSGESDPALKQQMLNYGALGYISKPFNPDTFPDNIARAIKGQVINA